MTVKELINELLEYDLDGRVEIILKTNRDEEAFNFGIEEMDLVNGIGLIVDVSEDELVDKDYLEELKEKVEELEG